MDLNKDFYTIIQDLSIFHNVFVTLWKMGVPSFTDSIPTACVEFNTEGKCIDFKFNPEFWNSIDEYTRAFVIAHECLHVILDHGSRSKGCNHQMANVALDVAVNHMLVNKFDFERYMVNDADKYCWTDTVFDKEKYGVVPDDKNFEYYYELISKDKDSGGQGSGEGQGSPGSGSTGSGSGDKTGGFPGSGQETVDQHREMTQEEIDAFGDMIQDALDALSDSERASVEGAENGTGKNGSPTGVGPDYTFVDPKDAKRKVWDSIIKEIGSKEKPKVNSQFVYKNRRMSLLGGAFMPPQEYEVDIKKNIPDVWMFLDCSSSCHHLRDIFFTLSQTIDPKKYNVRFFSMTTRVKELVKQGNTYTGFGSGGTHFECIEEYIQGELKSKRVKKHPAVVLFSDGENDQDMEEPQCPEKWYFMLDGTKRYLPKSCKNVYKIKDVF